MRGQAMPAWSRVFFAAVILLLINLLWNDPLQKITGGGTAAVLLFNVLPSAVVVGRLLMGWAR
ncbi:MAG: hypothetical protein ABIQ72_16580 [Usitatibacter sp.]